jgi:hypothetical protein
MDEQDLLNIPEQENANFFSDAYDKELFENNNENDYFKLVIRDCKDRCMGYLRSKNFILLSDDELKDIFADSIIILLERIRNGGLILTVPLQVYLIGVCRIKLLQVVNANNTINRDQGIENYNEDGEDFNIENNESAYDFEEVGENLAYAFEDESEIRRDFLERRIINMTQLLEKMRINGESCYDLITLYSYKKLRIADITRRLGYASDAVTRNLRSRCLRRFRRLSTQIN